MFNQSTTPCYIDDIRLNNDGSNFCRHCKNVFQSGKDGSQQFLDHVARTDKPRNTIGSYALRGGSWA